MELGDLSRPVRLFQHELAHYVNNKMSIIFTALLRNGLG